MDGIAVFNSPYSNTRSVAELVVAESIMLMRRITERSHAAHEGIWMKDTLRSYEIRGKKLGIVGYGHIGSQVSVLAENMGMEVIYYDIAPKLPLGNARRVKTLESLLALADVVTLHVPADPATVKLIGARQLSQMKTGAVLLNLSRGSVVDIEALSNALQEGHLSGASVDVFPDEPGSNESLFESSLQKLPNVILTPHIGGSTIEAQENIGVDVSDKMISFMDSGSTVGSHTIPPLSLPVQQDTNRILHIHKNVPGVLSSMNQVFSDLGINITGQYLKTNDQVGYVVFDIDKDTEALPMGALREVPHTIKARILY